MATKVIFKKEKGATGVYALFPESSEGNYCITSYTHIDQHSPASKTLMKARNAAKEEYQDLLAELVNVGYDDLIVLNEVKK